MQLWGAVQGLDRLENWNPTCLESVLGEGWGEAYPIGMDCIVYAKGVGWGSF